MGKENTLQGNQGSMSAYLPIFPLNAVLFPGGEMTLKIFEPRYKKMLGACLEKKTPFGVVYCESYHDEIGTLSPYGCTARIIKNHAFSDGTHVVTVSGEKRFRVGGINRDAYEYPVTTPAFEEGRNDLPPNDPLIRGVRTMAQTYKGLMQDIDPSLLQHAKPMKKPLDIKDAWQAIDCMVLPEDRRMEALTLGSRKERFHWALDCYRVEIERLRFVLMEQGEDGSGPAIN